MSRAQDAQERPQIRWERISTANAARRAGHKDKVNASKMQRGRSGLSAPCIPLGGQPKSRDFLQSP
ncbi:hypothetical protein R50076_21280 [Gilvimarinus japonicus]